MTKKKMSKVKFGQVLNASVKVDNSTDDEREFDISANVQISGNTVQNFYDGYVTAKTDGSPVKATWSQYSAENTQVNYTTPDVDEKCAIIRAVSEFIAEVQSAELAISM